jgi:predicted DNA-binding transcriptional regulator YafY
MAVHKKALVRYQAIDACLSHPTKWHTLEELIQKVEYALRDHYPDNPSVSRRTIYLDLNFLESESGYRAPIARRKGREGFMTFAYEDRSFSIFKTPLKDFELAMMSEWIKLLELFQGKPQLEYWQEAILHWKEQYRLNHTEGTAVVAFSDNPYLRNRSVLQDLYRFILERQVILVMYHPFAEDPIELYIHPYLLKEYNNRWFLFGWQEGRERIFNMAIDRIDHIIVADIPYKDAPDDWQETYFDDIIGVTHLVDMEVTTVEIWADATVSPYLLTKPIHGSQKSYPKGNGQYHFVWQLKPNMELENILLSLGEQIEVLRPIELRAHIHDRLMKAMDRYRL